MSKSNFKISCETSNSKAIIRIDGYISNWTNNASNFKSQLDQIRENGVTDLAVYLNSGGGDCFEANEIANELIKFPGTTEAHIGALCASAATYIASKMKHVTVARNTSYMIHKPMMTVSGNAPQIESDLKNLKNMQAEYAQTYADKTGMTVAEVEALWPEDFWMNAEEAKKLGFINEIEGEADLSEEDIEAVEAQYKKAPKMVATIQKITNQKIEDPMKDKILLILASVPGVTLTAASSDEQVLAIVEALKGKAAKADDYKTKLDAAVKEGKAKEISAFLEKAADNKQILATEIPYYTGQMEANYEPTKAHIEAKPKLTRLTDTTKESTNTSVSGVDTSKWTYEDYQDKDPQALQKLAETDEPKFTALFKAHYGTMPS